MSLINEALKKAQRVRHEGAAEPSAPSEPGGVRIARRGKAHSANTMVLVGSGAIVLVVLSVVATVYLVNRPPAPAVAALTPAPETIRPAAAAESAAPVSLPSIVPAPPASPPVDSTPAPIVTDGATSTASAAATIEPSPAASPASAAGTLPSAPAVEQSPPPPAPPVPDERVAAFVEAIRVTGIRSSGTESRVLMNDRVFRVNDIVERTLHVRLIKVAADSLTFSDAKGVVYVKNF